MSADTNRLFAEENITAAEPNAAANAKGPSPENATPEKQYYSIGEVAALFSVRTSHIRFWTTEFGLKVRTTKKGDRLYSPAIINELRTIYHLVKERGFTIAGAKAKLSASAGASINTTDLKAALLQLRSQLLIIRNKL